MTSLLPTRRDGGVPPLRSPAPRAGLLEVFQRRYLLRLLVRREINARYSGSFLGLIWSYINPLSQFCIYYFILGKLLDRGTPNFAVHVFAGMIVVHFFNETFNAGTRSMVRNKNVIRKMALPREMFPVASMLVSLYHVAPQLLILLVVCLAYGWNPDPMGLLAIVMAITLAMLLGTGLALLFSVANVFFRDFASVVGILTNFVRFGVPMIYPYSIVEERFGETLSQYYLYNPLASAVLLVQRATWYGTLTVEERAGELPSYLFERGAIMIAIAAVFLVFAQWVFRHFEDRIPERLT